MPRNLQVDADLDATDQVVKDESGDSSPLTLSTDRVTIQSNNPNPEAVLHISSGPAEISNPGDGKVLMTLGTERPWVLKQTGSGASTALEFTAADATNNNKNFIINTEGGVGIGTQSPRARLHVSGGQIAISNPGDGNVLMTLGIERAWVLKQTGSGASTALEFTAADATNNNKNFIINTEGRVGIGTQTPQAKLDVNGSITVSDDILLTGADCAEEFDIHEDSQTQPGTVMVITSRRQLRHSCQAYDHRVAGIVAGAGNLRSGIVLGRRGNPGRFLPVALSGTTYCRVDASAHPINVGDMLTTSDLPGLAMRATDRERSFGAVIGKALSGLTNGVGLVPVLVSLQ